MKDLFNNSDIIIQNATQKDIGLVPDGVGLLILKPKEDSFYLAKTISDFFIEPGKEGIFQATTYDNYPIEIGVGIYVNNSLQEMVYIYREKDELHSVVNLYGDILTNPIKLNEPPHKLNTLAIGYFHSKYIGFINHYKIPVTFSPPVFNEPSCFYVKFDTPLKAVMLHTKIKDDDIRVRMTEKPNYLIRSIDE